MNLKPVKHTTLTESIRQEVLQYIYSKYEEKSWKLPPEQELADLLQVSRNTLRQVLSQLEAEGILLRRHGRGTFLNPEALKVRLSMFDLIDFSDIVRRCGHNPSHRIYSLENAEADEELARILEIQPGEEVLCVEYWLYADGLPCIAAVGWCARDIFFRQVSYEIWERSSCFRVLGDYAGRTVGSDRVRVRTMTLEQMEKRLGHRTELQCASVLCLDSVAFDQNDTPVVWGNAYFDTSLIQFDLFRRCRD